MKTKEMVRVLHEADKNLTAEEIAKMVGVGVQAVYDHARTLGIKFPPKPFVKMEPREVTPEEKDKVYDFLAYVVEFMTPEEKKQFARIWTKCEEEL